MPHLLHMFVIFSNENCFSSKSLQNIIKQNLNLCNLQVPSLHDHCNFIFQVYICISPNNSSQVFLKLFSYEVYLFSLIFCTVFHSHFVLFFSCKSKLHDISIHLIPGNTIQNSFRNFLNLIKQFRSR